MPANNDIPLIELLGLDVGDARVGIARANAVAKIPQALQVAPTASAIEEIVALASEYKSDAVVIGIPLQPDGKEGEQAKRVRTFASKLHSKLPVQQLFIDESFTSLEADSYIHSNEPSAQHNDDIAACIVLQRYFEGGARV